MSATTIEWTQMTWNPVRGCRPISPGCKNCYAERIAARNLPAMKSPTTGKPFAIMRSDGPHWTGTVELIPHMLDVPMKRRKPTTWFVNSMSDLFHEDLSDQEIARVFRAICECRGRHTFQILTKRSNRLREWFQWAKISEPGWFDDRGVLDLWKTWIGVSIESRAYLSRIDDLRDTPAALRFLSIEPLLEDLGEIDLTGIHWVIVGGESGPGSRIMRSSWVESIRNQCLDSGVPFFFKQWGEYLPDQQNPAMTTEGRSISPPWGAIRMGKRAAGRLIDGRTWDEMPIGGR